MSDAPKTPLHEIVAEVQNVTGESDVLTVLNSRAPFEAECAKQEISKDKLLSMFNESQKIDAQILLTNQDSQSHANEIAKNDDWGTC